MKESPLETTVQTVAQLSKKSIKQCMKVLGKVLHIPVTEELSFETALLSVPSILSSFSGSVISTFSSVSNSWMWN